MALRLILSLVLLATLADSVAAQRIEIRGRGDIENDAFLSAYVERPDLRVVSTDTLVVRGDTLRGSVLIVDATVRIEGVVVGDLVIVDGNLFLRPSAVVTGELRNIAGGYYPSELASVEGGVTSEPNAAYRADRVDDDVIVITGLTHRRSIVFDGFYGLRPPTYDRVDGVTLSWGAGLLLPRAGRVEPVLRGHVDYRSQRGAITGGGELEVRRGRTALAAGVERTTLTNEEWVRGALLNSVSFFFLGKDYRDYYEADRAYAELRRTFAEGPTTLRGRLGAQIEEARSLAAGSPWTLFGSPREENLVIDDGRIASVIGALRLDLEHALHAVRVEAAAEVTHDVFEADHDFARYVIDADWEMAAIRDHTLGIEAHFRGPFPGTTSLPRQRWSFIGGSGTLPTFPFAAFRGDRLAFVETTYSIPLPPRFRMRLLGVPTFDLLHAAGMAWTADERPPFEQNLGVRLHYTVVFARVLTNPRNFRDDVRFTVGLTLPRRDRPWQEPQ